MTRNKTSNELLREVERFGITMFSDSNKIDKPSSASNTYIFSDKNNTYILDPAFGDKRCREISAQLNKDDQFDILCTHYHNDHSANNGKIAGKKTVIYYHSGIKTKMKYLRTNGTGQIVAMGKSIDLQGMLKRFKMFPGWLITAILFSSKISSFFPSAFLFIVSYAYSWKHIGQINPGRKHAKYLEPSNLRKIHLDEMEVNGWVLDKHLIALDTIGHTDDHLVYYLADRKVLFTGDALNFLNANDIQFGDIDKVNETISFILEFTKKENVKVLLQGHYYPVTGTENIIRYVTDIRDKHNEILNITGSVVKSMQIPVKFDHVLSALYSHPAEIVQYLTKITFPRSTLVFLDVYLLKVLQSLGYSKQKDGYWVR